MTELMIYDVYIKVDNYGRIVAVNSTAFVSNTSAWRKIDSGKSANFYHAQGNYFPKIIMDDRGVYRYMTALIADNPDREAFHTYEFEGEQWGIYERTQAEMDADWVEPVPAPNPNEKITQLEQQVAALSAALLNL